MSLYEERNALAKAHPNFKDWISLGKENPWISKSWDPEFNERSFYMCLTIEELKEKLDGGNWSIGTAFCYKDLCFINQIDGGDEWLTIKNNISFESITGSLMIKRNSFDSFLERVLKATDGQLRNLNY